MTSKGLEQAYSQNILDKNVRPGTSTEYFFKPVEEWKPEPRRVVPIADIRTEKVIEFPKTLEDTQPQEDEESGVVLTTDYPETDLNPVGVLKELDELSALSCSVQGEETPKSPWKYVGQGLPRIYIAPELDQETGSKIESMHEATSRPRQFILKEAVDLLYNQVNRIPNTVEAKPAGLTQASSVAIPLAVVTTPTPPISKTFDASVELEDIVFKNKDVVFVGDGDGIALSAAHLKAQNVISYGPKSITVLDFDERIVNSVRRFGEKLQPKIEISAHLYNVAEALPLEHFGAYDGFHINPPWGASNDGESVMAFLERGSQATKEKSLGIVVMADDPDLLWTQEVLRDTQRHALELGYVVSELLPQLHLYHLDDAPDLRSCSCLFRRIKPGCMQTTSEPLEPRRLENFYGKSSPLRFRYVRERPTLNTDRESDQLYILEKLEVDNGSNDEESRSYFHESWPARAREH